MKLIQQSSIPTKLPKNLYQYFWEVDPKMVNPRKSPQYVINRLLDKGEVEAVRWTRRHFPEELIVHTLKTLRDFTPKRASFWAAFYNLSEEEVRCLQEPYRSRHKMLWPY